jgi:ATP-dependent Clp protease ATP-binding subunit ClpX
MRRLACSFCGTPDHLAQRLIAGPRVLICDACVARCNAILAAHPPEATGPPAPAERAGPPPRWWRRLAGWWSAARSVASRRLYGMTAGSASAITP